MTTDQYKAGQQIVNQVVFLSEQLKKLKAIDQNGIKKFIVSPKDRISPDFELFDNCNAVNGIENQPQTTQIVLTATIKILIEYYTAEIAKLETEFGKI